MAASVGAGAGAVNGEGVQGAQGGPKATSVSVDDSETWVESKRYTVYKVVVRKADKAYFVFRRSVFTRTHTHTHALILMFAKPVDF